MSTSGTFNFSVTRDDIIRNAMLITGKIGDLEVPTASEQKDCSMFLSMLVKQWMGRQDFAPGLKMWKRRRGDLYLSFTTGSYNLGPSGDNWTETSYSRTLTANATSTTLTVSSITNVSNGDFIGIELDNNNLFWTTVNGAPSGSTITLASALPSQASSGNMVFNYTTKAQRPLYLETAVLRDTNNQDTPVNFMTLQDWQFLSSKNDPTYISDPRSGYYESQLTNGKLFLDVGGAQDVTKKLVISYMEPVQDITNPTDNPEFPQQWYMALSWGLARQIAPIFNAVWTEAQEGMYREAVGMAREADSETTSLYFQPGNEGLSWQ